MVEVEHQQRLVVDSQHLKFHMLASPVLHFELFFWGLQHSTPPPLMLHFDRSVLMLHEVAPPLMFRFDPSVLKSHEAEPPSSMLHFDQMVLKLQWSAPPSMQQNHL